MTKVLTGLLLLLCMVAQAQRTTRLSKEKWVDSVFRSLNENERIGQLMVARLSARTPSGVVWYDSLVAADIRKYNIGAVCLFQGGPVMQAETVNRLQQLARTPLMVCVDAEWGLGMRFDSVANFPFQLTLGAVSDPGLVYQVGRAIGEQCRRIGIHVNYAPVVDINNNPDNPVINFRSFGEDKFKVAEYGIRMMKGMQDEGVMACAKHFPGHGDVAVDSHLDLPVIYKSLGQLDSLELYPFREIFKAGIGSVMIAHLYIPSIDSSANRATSLSYNNITRLMKQQLGYEGLTFTDALEMQGVRKFFPAGMASVESLIAGNDMLCLPGNIDSSVLQIRRAIDERRLTWELLNTKVKRVLAAKYDYVITNVKPVATADLARDLNAKVPALRQLVAQHAITLLKNDDPAVFPLPPDQNNRLAYVGLGISSDNAFARRLRADYNADVFYFDYKSDAGRILSMMELLKKRYDAVIVGVHNYTRYPANNFGISAAALQLLKRIQEETRSITFYFGNPYAIKNSCHAANLVACYEDDEVFHQVAAEMLEGLQPAMGKLPVTICESLPYGTGIIGTRYLPHVHPAAVGFNEKTLSRIDSLAADAIAQRATPGCVILVAKDGKIAYQKAFGHYTYDSLEAVSEQSIYDMASVTKIFATTLAVMKLYDEGKLQLDRTLGDYLPWVRGSNKEHLRVRDILLHEAGLVAWIPFYRETIDTSRGGLSRYEIYSEYPVHSHRIRVAQNMYIRNDWIDTMYRRIVESPLGATGKYIYSDNDFIFLGKIVETLTDRPLNEYVESEFYSKLGLTGSGFRPRQKFALGRIAPTEQEAGFRAQLIRGDVHDPGAAMFGGVAGHAGLFSTAGDLALIAQMLLNGGSMSGHRFIQPKTIDLFTAYHSATSRRGYGFDKPEKDNATSREPYPTLSASPETYGHTGFTGTCVWVDPAYNLVYVFLSNRVNPHGSNRLSTMRVRANIHEMIYAAMAEKK